MPKGGESGKKQIFPENLLEIAKKNFNRKKKRIADGIAAPLNPDEELGLSDIIKKVITTIQQTLQDSKLDEQTRLEIVGQHVIDIKAALDSPSVVAGSDEDQYKKAQAWIQSMFDAQAKKDKEALKTITSDALKESFGWDVLNKSAAIEKKKKVEHQKREALILSPKDDFTRQINSLNRELINILRNNYHELDIPQKIERLQSFVQKFNQVVGNDLKERFKYIHTLFMEQLNNMESKTGAGETIEEEKAQAEKFSQGFNIISSLLIPSLLLIIPTHPDFINNNEAIAQFNNSIELFKKGVFSSYSPDRHHTVHDADIAEITAALGKIKEIVQKVTEDKLRTGRGAGPGAG